MGRGRADTEGAVGSKQELGQICKPRSQRRLTEEGGGGRSRGLGEIRNTYSTEARQEKKVKTINGQCCLYSGIDDEN